MLETEASFKIKYLLTAIKNNCFTLGMSDVEKLLQVYLGKTNFPGSESFGASRTSPVKCSFLAKTPTL